MMQPFEIFEQRYLDQLLSMKRIYVVTQTYTRAINHIEDGGRIALLLTDYDDRGGALIHYNAVKRKDSFGYLLDLANPVHLAKLQEMMAGDKYRLYWSVVKSVPDLERRITASFKTKVRRYVEVNTNWRIAGDDTLKTTLEVIFGEIFITLIWKSRQLRVKFEDIEKS